MDTVDKLKYLRKSNNLTQEDVAKKIGTTGSNYSQYESKEQTFTIEHIKKLATLYGVTISYLLDDNNDKEILLSKEELNKLIEAKNVIEKIEKSYSPKYDKK